MILFMIDQNRLCAFLVEAKTNTYAAGDVAEKILENDQSTTLIYENGDLRYHDNYFGGEPFGGREVVFLKDDPIYIMVYYGLVQPSVSDFDRVYVFLQKALSLIPESHPFRGPNEYVDGDLIYKNTYTGGVDHFFGEEVISSTDGKELYRARYAGGFICQRA